MQEVVVREGPHKARIEGILAGPNLFEAPPNPEAIALQTEVFADANVTFAESTGNASECRLHQSGGLRHAGDH